MSTMEGKLMTIETRMWRGEQGDSTFSDYGNEVMSLTTSGAVTTEYNFSVRALRNRQTGRLEVEEILLTGKVKPVDCELQRPVVAGEKLRSQTKRRRAEGKSPPADTVRPSTTAAKKRRT